MNIPARYCTGYLSDIGEPCRTRPGLRRLDGGLPRWPVADFDPRNNAPRIGRILIARGRDAADVPLTYTFGPNELTGFEVGPTRSI